LVQFTHATQGQLTIISTIVFLFPYHSCSGDYIEEVIWHNPVDPEAEGKPAVTAVDAVSPGHD
jgi:hypothetical protein